MVNAGKTTEAGEGPRRRRRLVTRRVGVVPVKALSVRRPYRDGDTQRGRERAGQIEKAEEALFTALHSAIWTGAPTCLLDVAGQGALTLEQTGDVMNITRERVRQLEVRALAKLNADAGDELREAAVEVGADHGSNEDAWNVL